MKPNLLVTFDARVRLQLAVLADGPQAGYFAASINARHRLMANKDLVAELASRGLAILDLTPTDLVSVDPINESTRP